MHCIIALPIALYFCAAKCIVLSRCRMHCIIALSIALYFRNVMCIIERVVKCIVLTRCQAHCIIAMLCALYCRDVMCIVFDAVLLHTWSNQCKKHAILCDNDCYICIQSVHQYFFYATKISDSFNSSVTTLTRTIVCMVISKTTTCVNVTFKTCKKLIIKKITK